MENLQLKSLVTAEGYVELFLESSPVPDCAEDEVLIEVHAAPINPSDMGALFASADMSTAELLGSPHKPRIRAMIPESMRKAVAAREGKALACGNEGAGIVVATGNSQEAKALMGKTVAVLGGRMYSKYRINKAKTCLKLLEGTTPKEGASCFVNPLTAIGMVETMRMEGHSALVHTAAASNLGQMLQKFCINEDVNLVNIVRKQEHVDLLKGIGAKYVCNTSSPSFFAHLTDVLAETKATIAFDALGGGELAGDILTAMEHALSRDAATSGPYGSTTHKQVYIYGGLDRSATKFKRSFGMSWGMGGYLLTPFLQKIGRDAANKLRQKVAAEITSTFASSYTKEVSFQELLTVEAISVIDKRATGEKYLVNPSQG